MRTWRRGQIVGASAFSRCVSLYSRGLGLISLWDSGERICRVHQGCRRFRCRRRRLIIRHLYFLSTSSLTTTYRVAHDIFVLAFV